MRDILDLILSPDHAASSKPPVAPSSDENWLPIERAVAAGFTADRLGYAFAGAYQAALEALIPSLPKGRASLCATEVGGVSPRAIMTRLELRSDGNYRLSGHKKWATLSPSADWLLVACTSGSDEKGRNRLRLACIPATREGVRVQSMPPTPFVPEILHGEVFLDGARVASEELLPGDAWDGYLKPFRTVEDLFVQSAVFGYLLGVASRHGWSQGVRERFAAIVVALRALSTLDWSAPATHVALAGTLAIGQEAIASAHAEWEKVDGETRSRWQRDVPLLMVAAGARAKRVERAWARISDEK